VTKYKIKSRIFILQMIIILIPFILISTYFYFLSKDQIESQQKQQLELKIEQASRILDKYQEEIRTYALIIANSNEMKHAIMELKDEPEWSFEDESLVNNYPHETFNTVPKNQFDARFVKLEALAQNAFHTLSDEQPYIGNIEIMNKNIVVIMRGHRDKRGDVKTDKLIKNAVSGSSSSGYLVSKRTGQPAIDGTAPVFYNDEIVGGVKVGMYITQSVASDIEEQIKAQFLSFDQDILIRTDSFEKEKINQKDSSEYDQHDLFYTSVNENGEAEIKIKREIYDKYINQGDLYIDLYSKSGNNNVTVGIKPIRNYDDEIIGAYMLSISNDTMLHQINDILVNTLIGIAFIILLAVAVSYIFSHQIGNPLVSIKKQIEKMKAENAIKPLNNIHGPEELQDVSYEFNSLIDTITYHKNENKKLEIISNIDGLTGLLNHRKFYQDISGLLEKSNAFSLVFFDLDKFKSINDTLGHFVGDAVLREISNFLKTYESDSIKAYRYGGEEFAMLVGTIDKREAFEFAEAIRKGVEKSETIQSLSPKKRITISVGVSSYPIDSSLENEVISFADLAMYVSKRNGRNRTTMYDKDALFVKDRRRN
jgi:diguanylate cyclase (GGDEF)-like protein